MLSELMLTSLDVLYVGEEAAVYTLLILRLW